MTSSSLSRSARKSHHPFCGKPKELSAIKEKQGASMRQKTPEHASSPRHFQSCESKAAVKKQQPPPSRSFDNTTSIKKCRAIDKQVSGEGVVDLPLQRGTFSRALRAVTPKMGEARAPEQRSMHPYLQQRPVNSI